MTTRSGVQQHSPRPASSTRRRNRRWCSTTGRVWRPSFEPRTCKPATALAPHFGLYPTVVDQIAAAEATKPVGGHCGLRGRGGLPADEGRQPVADGLGLLAGGGVAGGQVEGDGGLDAAGPLPGGAGGQGQRHRQNRRRGGGGGL